MKRIPTAPHLNVVKEISILFIVRTNSHYKKTTCKPGFKRFINIQSVLVEDTYKLCNLCNLNISFQKIKQILINDQIYIMSLNFT